jgi:hypothetical protein
LIIGSIRPEKSAVAPDHAPGLLELGDPGLEHAIGRDRDDEPEGARGLGGGGLGHRPDNERAARTDADRCVRTVEDA